MAPGEHAEECGLSGARVVPAPTDLPDGLAALLRVIEDGCVRGLPVTKADVVTALAAVVPELAHVETGKSLDHKM